MKEYLLPTLFFKKSWRWFAEPEDVSGIAVSYFFSYAKGDYAGFQRKETVTSLIDLRESLEVIWGRMRKNFIRKQIEKGARQGVVVQQSKDFKSFYPLYHSLSKQKKFGRMSYSTIRSNGLLFLAYYQERVIAGGVFIADGEYMRAWILASARAEEARGQMREVIGEANRMVIWEAIQYAKQTGYQVFDLGGIAPDSNNTGWRAVAEFKEGFGGARVSAYYYLKIYSPLLRLLIRLRHLMHL